MISTIPAIEAHFQEHYPNAWRRGDWEPSEEFPSIETCEVKFRDKSDFGSNSPITQKRVITRDISEDPQPDDEVRIEGNRLPRPRRESDDLQVKRRRLVADLRSQDGVIEAFAGRPTLLGGLEVITVAEDGTHTTRVVTFGERPRDPLVYTPPFTPPATE
jgi:hypothetical protein